MIRKFLHPTWLPALAAMLWLSPQAWGDTHSSQSGQFSKPNESVIEVQLCDLSARFTKAELKDINLVRGRLGFPHFTHAQHQNMQVPLAAWYQKHFEQVIFVIGMSMKDPHVHTLHVHWRKGNGEKGFRIASYDFTKTVGENQTKSPAESTQ